MNQTVVGVFNSHEAAERAAAELERQGFERGAMQIKATDAGTGTSENAARTDDVDEATGLHGIRAPLLRRAVRRRRARSRRQLRRGGAPRPRGADGRGRRKPARSRARDAQQGRRGRSRRAGLDLAQPGLVGPRRRRRAVLARAGRVRAREGPAGPEGRGRDRQARGERRRGARRLARHLAPGLGVGRAAARGSGCRAAPGRPRGLRGRPRRVRGAHKSRSRSWPSDRSCRRRRAWSKGSSSASASRARPRRSRTRCGAPRSTSNASAATASAARAAASPARWAALHRPADAASPTSRTSFARTIQTNFANTGASYDELQPAYRGGYELRATAGSPTATGTTSSRSCARGGSASIRGRRGNASGGGASRLGSGDELTRRGPGDQVSGIQPSTGSIAAGMPRSGKRAERAACTRQSTASRRSPLGVGDQRGAQRCVAARARRRAGRVVLERGARSPRAPRRDRGCRGSCTNGARSARARAGADTLRPPPGRDRRRAAGRSSRRLATSLAMPS